MKNNNKADESNKPPQGFLKLMRSPFTIELLRDLLAFGLLALIAFRARWRSGFSADGLEIGEALIGDYKNCGMTRWQYRERLARLVKWGFITARATPKGTIARLTSTAVFDTNLAPPTVRQKTAKNQPSTPPTDLRVKTSSQPPTRPPTNRQRTANRPPLTKNDKKGRKKEYDDSARELGAELVEPDQQSSSSNLSLKATKKHPLWPQFEAYCLSNGGAPTLKGWNTWLPKQSKARVAKAFAQDRDKIMAQRHDLVSQYCNGALTADERIHAFRRFAPLEVQQEYNLLGSRLQGAKPNKKGN